MTCASPPRKRPPSRPHNSLPCDDLAMGSTSPEEAPTINWVLDKAKSAVMRCAPPPLHTKHSVTPRNRIESYANQFHTFWRWHGIRGLVIDPYNVLDHTRSAFMSETEYISSMLFKVRKGPYRCGSQTPVVCRSCSSEAMMCVSDPDPPHHHHIKVKRFAQRYDVWWPIPGSCRTGRGRPPPCTTSVGLRTSSRDEIFGGELRRTKNSEDKRRPITFPMRLSTEPSMLHCWCPGRLHCDWERYGDERGEGLRCRMAG